MDWKTLALLSAFFAGLTAILAKIGVKDVAPNLATLIRTFVIVPFLILIVFLKKDWPPASIPIRGWVFLLLSGLTTGFSWLFYFNALQKGPASLVSSIDKLSLAIAVFLSFIFLGEHLTPWQWVGVAMMIGGVYLIGMRAS